MKTTRLASGKISEHFKGVGTVTRDMVIRRARELALINGREAHRYSKEDFLEAKRELTGCGGNASELAGEEPIAGLTSWDEEPGTSGHAVERMPLADEQNLVEQLVEQGLNEAEHDRMVEGARSPENQE